MERLSRAFATTVDCQMAWVNSASTSMLLNSSSLISGRFDRRIHRLSDISSVAAFEVDHPATVAGKLAALVRNCRQTCVFWRSISIGRSEERRVGKECRSRWSADHEKKNGTRMKESTKTQRVIEELMVIW